MKTATAIRTFFNNPGNNPFAQYTSVSVAEIKELKEACSPEEYRELGRQACELLGEKFEG